MCSWVDANRSSYYSTGCRCVIAGKDDRRGGWNAITTMIPGTVFQIMPPQCRPLRCLPMPTEFVARYAITHLEILILKNATAVSIKWVFSLSCTTYRRSISTLFNTRNHGIGATVVLPSLHYYSYTAMVRISHDKDDRNGCKSHIPSPKRENDSEYSSPLPSSMHFSFEREDAIVELEHLDHLLSVVHKLKPADDGRTAVEEPTMDRTPWYNKSLLWKVAGEHLDD